MPKDAERQILILSDLSGPGGGDQFDPYLTGYPVESADYYALARTWPAPEMGRPGCVWTHTLFIGMDLLEELEQPEALLKLFRRPSREAGFNGYLESLSLPSDVEPALNRDPLLGSELIRALYGRASPYTVLPVPRYSIAESPFLSVWRLQWASLRQHFTFCTGVRHRRSLEGEVFHLQAALPRDVRRLDRGPTPLAVVDSTAPEALYEEWVRIAVDAYRGFDNSLLEFFGRLGRTMPGNTALFRPVVQTFLILNRPGTDSIDELIRYAVEEYPQAESGRDYKRALLGENVAQLPETELIKRLSLSDKYASFDPATLQMRSRSAGLWSSEEKAWGLLVDLLTVTPNPLGEEAVLGLMSAMPPSILCKAVWSQSEVLIGLIRREPKLALNVHLWDFAERQSFVAEVLSACREQLDDEVDAIIRIALVAQADPMYPSLFAVFGSGAVASTLNWLDEDPAHHIPNGWRSVLSGQTGELLEWLQSHPEARRETVYFVLTTIDLDSSITSPLLVEALRRYVEVPVADEGAIIVASRALQKSLSNWAPNAVDLASVALDTVYHAAAASRVPDYTWLELLPFLPVTSWRSDWDRCEHLRRGIAEKFRSQQWLASKLTGITRDDRLFAEIIGELRERRSGRRVIAASAQTECTGPRRELMLSD